MITREQVADLREGDVVELQDDRWPGAVLRGPLRESAPGVLRVANKLVRDYEGRPSRFADTQQLTVVSRAPRPLYVNHPRTEPVAGDVVRDADDDTDTMTWNYAGGSGESVQGWYDRDGQGAASHHLPERLRLLVDGETGQVVP